MSEIYFPLKDTAAVTKALLEGITQQSMQSLDGTSLFSAPLAHHSASCFYFLVPCSTYSRKEFDAQHPHWVSIRTSPAETEVYNRNLHAHPRERYEASRMSLERFLTHDAGHTRLVEEARQCFPRDIMFFVYLDEIDAHPCRWQSDPEPPLDMFAHDDEMPASQPMPAFIDYVPEVRIPRQFILPREIANCSRPR